MAAAQSYFERKNATSIRAGLSHVAAAAPQSPHTPQRAISSTFSSPGANYRAEEEYVVLEIGTRYIRAGFAGDSRPRCTMEFGGEETRRVGDYRKWLPGYDEFPGVKRSLSEWGVDHELWCMDLRATDLGLVEDKLERAVREAYTRHLLLDSKSRRILLVTPSIMPHPLLSTTLSTLFNSLQAPGIMLLPSPLLAVLAAGQRTGLVVDIGWHEVTMTAVYEFREIRQSRTTRAMRLVTLETAKLLEKARRMAKRPIGHGDDGDESEALDRKVDVDFEFAEEFATRMTWCKSASRTITRSKSQTPEPESDLKKLSISEDDDMGQEQPIANFENDATVSFPASNGSSITLNIPFSQLSLPIEEAFFAQPDRQRDQDDHEQTVHYLLYQTLLSLSPDARSVCMSNIIFTGGGSNIPGLKSRLLDELSILVAKRGWDGVWGKAADERRRKLQEIHLNVGAAVSPPTPPKNFTEDTYTDSGVSEGEVPSIAAAFAPQTDGPIEERLRRDSSNAGGSYVTGKIRAVETLGPWTGASIAASMRLKGVVEIERDTFLQTGLAGAKRESDVGVAKSRQSLGLGLGRSGGVESVAWTLGAWA